MNPKATQWFAVGFLAVFVMAPTAAEAGDAESEPEEIPTTRSDQRDSADEEPEGEDVDEQGGEDRQLGDSVGDPGVPPPGHSPTVVRQWLYGTVTALGVVAVAGVARWGSPYVTDDSSLELWGVLGLTFGPLLGVPTAVNYRGNKVYPDQHVGAYIGTFAGTVPAVLAGVAAWALTAALTQEEGATETPRRAKAAGYAVYALSLTGGALRGYHTQLRLRKAVEPLRSSRLELGPALLGGAGDGPGAGMSIGGRF